jgi:L-alanine-DL-glutamate epimerase-like enolase superfamily enzyme
VKVADIRAYPLQYPEPHDSNRLRYVTLVRVETDAGATGWGECISQWPEAALAVKVIVERGMLPLLKGHNALETRGLWELMRRHSFWYGNGGIATFAVSAIDMALWDLKGHALGVPVYQLLGGKVTPRLRAVASVIFDTVDQDATADEFQRYVAAGYTAVKGGWGKTAETAFGLDASRDLSLVRRIRGAIGESTDFMLDVGTHVRWDAAHAIRMTRQFEQHRIYWIEEPLAPDDFDGYRRLRAAIETPIATGEKEWTVGAFRRLVDTYTADYIMPDVGKAEGITGVKLAIDYAALHNQLYNPHSWSTALNTAASLHLCASVPNCRVFELKPNPNPMQHELVAQPIGQSDGFVSPPEGPGLGVTVRDEAVREYLFD